MERLCEPVVFQAHPVTSDSFRGPLSGEEKGLILDHSSAARWTPEQVRGDECDKETDPAAAAPSP